MGKRLFIVSNRLPVSVSGAGEEATINVSSGGLVAAIASYFEDTTHPNRETFEEAYWLGVPGCNSGTWASVADQLENKDFTYVPVFMTKKVYDAYYNGLSNSVVWPLFHYFPSFAEYDASYFDAYLQANETFASVLIPRLHPNDIVWIHDYHLMPLARLIRRELPGITIGFFLHIPFPSYEVFRIMPKRWQREMLEGMLGADLVGFHTIDYATHFLKSVQMVLGLENDMHTIKYNNRLVKADIFPISVDFDKFYKAYDDKAVGAARKQLKEQFGERKVIFSVDRLDYTKGVHNRLKAYEQFLSMHPEYIGKVVFVLVVVPSRDSVSKYAERKKMIDESIGSINSRIGNIHWQPIIYQYNSLDFANLVALYTSCDLALITPVRDGMNLVAKEFVASRKDKQGVLVLSEMAGAVRELTDALTINPNDVDEIAEKIKLGLEMEPREQEYRITAMQERIREYNVSAWARDFFEQLESIKNKQREYEFKHLDAETKIALIRDFQQAESRLFLLDYDGTLAKIAARPSLAKPEKLLLEILAGLAEEPKNIIFIISGRDKQSLQEWLGALPINIISEHGANYRYKGVGWQPEAYLNTNWFAAIKQVMQKYVRRCTNSFIEVKEFSMAWHYRNADLEQGNLRAAELFAELLEYTNSMNIQILKGNKVIEVRNKGINKGSAVQKIMHSGTYDFILCCGDDNTDEEMFYQLADLPYAYTIKVGATASFAKYNLHTYQMVLSLLDNMRYMARVEARV